MRLQRPLRGWSKVYVIRDPFLRLGRYRAAEARARKSRRGVWRRCGGNFHTPA